MKQTYPLVAHPAPLLSSSLLMMSGSLGVSTQLFTEEGSTG